MCSLMDFRWDRVIIGYRIKIKMRFDYCALGPNSMIAIGSIRIIRGRNSLAGKFRIIWNNTLGNCEANCYFLIFITYLFSKMKCEILFIAPTRQNTVRSTILSSFTSTKLLIMLMLLVAFQPERFRNHLGRS